MSAAALAPQFGIPPYTDEMEQPENNTGLTTAPVRSAPSKVVGIIPFKQTDVIYAWLWKLGLTQTVTQGADTVTVSPMAPYNQAGQILLNMQQQYPAIAVNNLFDLVQVTNLRPFHRLKRGDYNYTQAVSAPNVGTAATNPYAIPTLNVTGTQQSFTLPIWLPASVYFDAYFELSYDGLPISGPHNGYISPQDMSGYARVVTPDITFNAAVGATLDIAPYFDSGTAATFAATATHTVQRLGVLGNTDPGTLPGPTNWQYNIAHQQFTIAGRSQVDIPLNAVFMGQIMSITLRMFDPAAAAGKGAMITNSTVTKMVLQFGGNGIRFQGAYDDCMRRFYDQHRYFAPDGVLQLDLATDRQGWISNQYLLNTLREAGVILHLEFSGTQSASAYIEVVVEGLRWVPLSASAQR